MHDCTQTMKSISQTQCKATHRDTGICFSPLTINAKQSLVIAEIPLFCHYSTTHQHWKDGRMGSHQVQDQSFITLQKKWIEKEKLELTNTVPKKMARV